VSSAGDECSRDAPTVDTVVCRVGRASADQGDRCGRRATRVRDFDPSGKRARERAAEIQESRREGFADREYGGGGRARVLAHRADRTVLRNSMWRRLGEMRNGVTGDEQVGQESETSQDGGQQGRSPARGARSPSNRSGPAASHAHRGVAPLVRPAMASAEVAHHTTWAMRWREISPAPR